MEGWEAVRLSFFSPFFFLFFLFFLAFLFLFAFFYTSLPLLDSPFFQVRIKIKWKGNSAAPWFSCLCIIISPIQPMFSPLLHNLWGSNIGYFVIMLYPACYCGSAHAGLEHTSHGFADLYDIVLNIPRSSWQLCRKCSKPKELSIYGRNNIVCIAVFELASYPGSLGEGKKEPGIYCLRMRLIIRHSKVFGFLWVRPCYVTSPAN